VLVHALVDKRLGAAGARREIRLGVAACKRRITVGNPPALTVGPPGRLYTGIPIPGRGGRVAEGTRLLSEYGHQVPSRVRIPPSP
jgi:hypothetical protein